MSPRIRRMVAVVVPIAVAVIIALSGRSGDGDGPPAPVDTVGTEVVASDIVAVDGPGGDEAAPGRAGPACVDGIDAGATITVAELPDEALETLALIAVAGPFPYRQDGATFQNREGELPAHERGYYREYTVETPGSDDRGARRIVTGECGEGWYTDDHYDSFALIEAPS